jgi:hypothetical protein
MKLSQQLILTSLLAITAVSTQVHAALPAGVDTAVTALQDDATAAITLIIPAVIAITSLFIIVKIIKKVLSKVG